MLMKRHLMLLFQAILLGSFAGVSAQVSINMPLSYDGDNGKTVTIGSEPTDFYDSGGANGYAESYMTDYDDCPAPASIHFTPKNAGEPIEITVSSLDLSDQAYFYIYDGNVVIDNSDGDYSYTLPSGGMRVRNSSDFPFVYTSKAADGSITIGYLAENSGGQGWKASLKSAAPKSMTYVGCESPKLGNTNLTIGMHDQPLFLLNVKTEGSLIPLKIDALTFTIDGNTSLEKIGLYYTENKSDFSTEQKIGEQGSAANILLATDITLKPGDNYFWLTGDIALNSAVNNKIAVKCSSVSVNKENKLASAITGEDLLVVADYCMQPSGTLAVGDSPLNFYDDGGKDGKISENFNGQVTFVPLTSGKKVMIDFTKVILFESGNKNEILRVYNGKEAKAANLIQQVKSGETVIIRSSSEDGALTVTLNCDTGLPKDGFEATVSEFTPQAMTVSEVIVEQYTAGTVAGGDINQPILSFNIKTKDTEPALTVTKFVFSTSGSYVKLAKATLYYTAKNGGFNTATKIGETIISGDEVEIIATNQISLNEGNNYFWLAYDIKPEVQNGDIIDAAITTVELSDGTHQVANGNPEGNRIVKNEYLSKVGTYERTILGTWSFKNTPNPSSAYDGYEPVQGDQIVTFVPATPGMIMELDFSDFHVYYSSSPYYGIRAKFEIYSGKGTSGEKLWSLDSSEDQDKGPGKLIRSNASDGSLTIVFDAKTTTSSYTAKGWTAEVREYLPKNMTFDGVEVIQANSEYVASGSTDQEILQLKVMTGGDKNPLAFNKVSLDLKGSQGNINKVSVFYTGKSNTFATGELIGSVDIAGTEESVEIPLNADCTLEEGDGYYWIAYDLKANAVPAQKVDAKLLSLTINNTVQPVATGDPEGDREIRNVYLMPTSGHETVHVGAYPYMFYDDGGADGKYSSAQSGSVTFVPAEGQVIKVVFNQFKTSSGDYLRFYNGEDAGTDLLAEYTMYSEPEVSSHILSKAADGSITVKFDRTGYSVNDGWEIEVTSYTALPLAYGSATATAVNRKQLLGGSLNEKMLCMALETTGDKGSFTVDELSFAVTNSDNLSAIKVYYTGTNNIFSSDAAALFGTEQINAAPKFTGTQEITEPGIYYFWLACDIKTDATIGAEISFVPTGIKVNGTSVGWGTPETATLTIKDGFHGTHTVGVNGEYKTLTAAIEDMEVDGINGPVILELENGSYDEAVVIPEIAGTSVVNTITIKSATGNYGDVTIYSSNYKSGDYGDADNGVLTVLGADYLIIDGVTFMATDQSYPYLVDIRNASTNVVVRNCYFQRPVDTASKRHLLHTDFVNGSIDGMPNTNMTIENNIFEGGYIGLEVGGQNAMEQNRNTGTRVLNNVFRNQASKSIYAKYDIGTLIEGNTIVSNCAGTSEYCGIDIFLGYEGVNIRNNRITLSGDYAVGIKIRPIAGTGTAHGRVYNNVVSMNMSGDKPSYGIYASQSTGKYFDIANNTIRITGTNTGTSGFYDATKTQYVTVQNNIIQNEAGGSAYWVNTSSVKVLSFNNNVIYSSGTKLVSYNSSPLDMDGWIALGKEADSYNEQVTFLSDDILAPKTLGNLNHGKPLDFVTTDITGSSRGAAYPTIGAYEYVEPTPAVMEEGYPVLSGEATYNAANVLVEATENAEIYYLCKTVNEVPAAEEIIAAGNKAAVSKGQEVMLQLEGLKGSTDYYVFFVLKTLSDDVLSDIYPLDKFTTAFLPTAVSTFEGVTVTEGTFEDGTASFDGFVVETITDGMGENNQKAARMTGTGATVTLTNTTTGLPLTGFYLKSDADVTVAVSAGQSKTVASTNGEWIFCNLKDMGDIISVTLSTEGTQVFIDDFSGEPQPITFMIDGVPDEMIAAGTGVTLSPYLYGGVPPYTYEWMNAGREVLSEKETYAFAADMTKDYILSVTDAWGTKEESFATVKVTGEAKTATFEDLYLAEESYNDRAKDGDGTYIFHSGTYEFLNTVGSMGETKYWDGFSYSNSTSTVYSGNLKEQYNSAVGSGANESSNYAVAYIPGTNANVKVTVANTKEGDIIDGCYISNNAWAVDVITTGDGFTAGDEGFEKGDYFKLTATGYDKDGALTSTADFYLADYRSENEADHYYLDTWQWLDLRALGQVKEVAFSLSGTKENAYGLTTPTYFCMDDFNGERVIGQGDAQTFGLGTSTVGLADFFTLADAVASVTYRIEDAYDETVLGATVGDGELNIDGKAEGTVNLVVSAVQKGKKQFVRIPVTIDPSASSLGNLQGRTVSIYPVPAVDRLNIATGMERYRIEVIAANGTSVYMKDNNSGETFVDVSGLENGIYLLRISSDDTSVVKRFTKVK